jgi:hypothetical protein
MKVLFTRLLAIWFLNAGDFLSDPPNTFSRLTFLPVSEAFSGMLRNTRTCSSNLLKPPLQLLQHGTVMRFDGRGFGNRFLGGRWSLVRSSMVRQR